MTPNKVLAAAKADVDTGYQEGENNKNKFGDWQGIPNQPWCASAVSFWFNLGSSVKLVAAQSKSKGFWSCDAGLKWFAKKGQVVPVGPAVPTVSTVPLGNSYEEKDSKIKYMMAYYNFQ